MADEVAQPEPKGEAKGAKKPEKALQPVETKGENKAPSAAQMEKLKKRRQLLMRARINLIKDFSNKVREKFGKYVKAVIIFGSFARGDYTLGSDTDVLIIIDDTESDKPIDQPMRDSLHNQMQDLATSIDKNIHTQLHTLTEFWDYIRNGDALFFNYLRTGIPVYDSGFYKPMNRILLSGAIKPSREAIFKSIDGAKSYLSKVTGYMEWAVERMFRAVTWSANAYLMAAGMPPAEVPELAPVMTKYFVEPGTLAGEHVATLDEVIKLHKGIEHGEVKGLSPDRVADLKKKCDKFMEVMEKGVNDLVAGKKRADDLKDKIRTTPKIFWTYRGKDRRGYAWLFEASIYAAIYEGKNLAEVMVSEIKEGKLQQFSRADSKELFATLERSTFKPIITTSLIQVIFKSIPQELMEGIEKAGVEYPNRALIDLSNILLQGERGKV